MRRDKGNLLPLLLAGAVLHVAVTFVPVVHVDAVTHASTGARLEARSLTMAALDGNPPFALLVVFAAAVGHHLVRNPWVRFARAAGVLLALGICLFSVANLVYATGRQVAIFDLGAVQDANGGLLVWQHTPNARKDILSAFYDPLVGIEWLGLSVVVAAAGFLALTAVLLELNDRALARASAE